MREGEKIKKQRANEKQREGGTDGEKGENKGEN